MFYQCTLELQYEKKYNKEFFVLIVCNRGIVQIYKNKSLLNS